MTYKEMENTVSIKAVELQIKEKHINQLRVTILWLNKDISGLKNKLLIAHITMWMLIILILALLLRIYQW